MTTWRMEDLDRLENARRVEGVCVVYPDGVSRDRAELELLLDDGERAYMYPLGEEVEVEEAARTARYRVEKLTKEALGAAARAVRLEGYGEQSEWRDLDTGSIIDPGAVQELQIRGSAYRGERLSVEARDGSPGRYLGRLPVPGFELTAVRAELSARCRALNVDVKVFDVAAQVHAGEDQSWEQLARLGCVAVRREGPHWYGVSGELVGGERVRLGRLLGKAGNEPKFQVFADPRAALAFAERAAERKQEVFESGGEADEDREHWRWLAVEREADGAEGRLAEGWHDVTRPIPELQGPLCPEVRFDGRWPPGSDGCPGLDRPELLMMGSADDPMRRLPRGVIAGARSVVRYGEDGSGAVAAHLESSIGGVPARAGSVRLYSPVSHSVDATQDHAMRVHAAVLERDEARAVRSGLESGVAAEKPRRERVELGGSSSADVERWDASVRNEVRSSKRWLAMAGVTAGVAAVGAVTGGAGWVAGAIGGVVAVGSLAMWGEAVSKARRARAEHANAIGRRPDVVVEEGAGRETSLSAGKARAGTAAIADSSRRWKGWGPKTVNGRDASARDASSRSASARSV